MNSKDSLDSPHKIYHGNFYKVLLWGNLIGMTILVISIISAGTKNVFSILIAFFIAMLLLKLFTRRTLYKITVRNKEVEVHYYTGFTKSKELYRAADILYAVVDKPVSISKFKELQFIDKDGSLLAVASQRLLLWNEKDLLVLGKELRQAGFQTC